MQFLILMYSAFFIGAETLSDPNAEHQLLLENQDTIVSTRQQFWDDFP